MEADVTSGVPETVLDLPGFRVLTAGEYAGGLEILVETTTSTTTCAQCGQRASAHGRREHVLRDIAVSGRATVLVWRKRLWRCRTLGCPVVTWSETMPGITARAALTDRVRVWAARQVGQHADTVAAVARHLGTGWATVMRAVTAVGQPLVVAAQRLAAVTALGVDEHAWRRANPARHTQFATGVLDLTPGRPARLLDVVAGRTGKVYGDWLSAPRSVVAQADRRRRVRSVPRLPDRPARPAAPRDRRGRRVPHHQTRLRRRVQQDQLGHRGRVGDPLYEVRRLLRRRADRLSQRNISKLETALHVGDPNDEILMAWSIAQDLARVYTAPDPATGKARAQKVIAAARTCPIPEIARLGRTLTAWQTEICTYFDTGGASNGPTEAINPLIEKIRRVGHDYRNFTNYRLRLLLHCGTERPTILTPRIRRRSPCFLASSPISLGTAARCHRHIPEKSRLCRQLRRHLYSPHEANG